jgi:hypothetical protein
LHHAGVLPNQERIDREAIGVRRGEMIGMKTKARLLLALIPLSLGGCGLYQWQKPGADDAAFKTDAAACEQQSRDGFDACMRGRGWTLKS